MAIGKKSRKSPSDNLTLVHVTHEATEQLGGIGAVLEGMIASPVYQEHVQRTILVGPTASHLCIEPEARLGEHGQVLYSSIDRIDRAGLSGKFRPMEWAFDVAIVYGKRSFKPPGHSRQGHAEVLLIDVFRANPDRLNVFKHRLWERFGIDSARYEKAWDYEEYVRLAEPAYYALQAILGPQHLPCVLFGHEYMGMPAVLQAILEGDARIRTVFHAHECATARRLVEDHPAHDIMFYNVLDRAREQGLFVEDVFGKLDDFARHALISQAHLCDGVIAVGDRTRDELRFLNQALSEHPIELVFNGLPDIEVTLASKRASRKMLLDYAQALVGYRPDVLLTHVSRPVISKAMWRDMQVCHELDRRLGQRGQKAVLFLLTSAGGVRRPQDVALMERQYGWPRHHRHGFPDLMGIEADVYRMIEPFNAEHAHVQIVLVNQFGWSRERIGQRLPEGMTIADLRRATDVELGMAVYEPFGISPLEPLGSGAVCVISSVCGCRALIEEVAGGTDVPNVIVADYIRLDQPATIPELLAMTREQRDRVEARVAGWIADELMRRLPTSDRGREKLIESGQALIRRMNWDHILEHHLIPLLHRLVRAVPNNNSGTEPGS